MKKPLYAFLNETGTEILLRLNEIKDPDVNSTLRRIAMELHGAAFYLQQLEDKNGD